MAGEITLKFTVLKNGMSKLAMKSPIFQPGPVEPQFGPGRYLTFEGFSVDEKGKQYGYDDYQIYLLLSCAPVQGHIAGIVDIPNACTTMGVPMDIFDFDIRPEAEAIKKDMGNCAFVSR